MINPVADADIVTYRDRMELTRGDDVTAAPTCSPPPGSKRNGKAIWSYAADELTMIQRYSPSSRRLAIR